MKAFNITVNGQVYEVQVEEVGGAAPVAATGDSPGAPPAWPRAETGRGAGVAPARRPGGESVPRGARRPPRRHRTASA